MQISEGCWQGPSIKLAKEPLKVLERMVIIIGKEYNDHLLLKGI